MKNNDERIDAVILWVDGSDEKWLAKKQQHSASGARDNNTINRYRDWGLLKYWFRSIEKNAPWINNIYFVSDNQKPKWLNINHPRLHLIDHSDIIPKKYLPTYNTNVIHYYIDQINGLSDKFILFDDDMFVLKKTKASDFFKNGKIVEEYSESLFDYGKSAEDIYPHELLNNIQYINQKFNKYSCYKHNPFKYFNLKYGLKNNTKTILGLPKKNLSGIYSSHICQAYTKKYMKIFKKECKKEIEKSSSNKFRSKDDFTRLVVKDLAIMEGDFVPRKHGFGIRYELSDDNKKLYKELRNPHHTIVCINDSGTDYNYSVIKQDLQQCFQKLFPNKSSFEKEEK